MRVSICVVSCACRCEIRAISSARLSCSRLRSAVHSATRDSTLGLGRRERLGELGGRVALALGHVGAPLLGEPTLILGQGRERLGAGERERQLETGGLLLGLACDDLVERGLAPVDLVLERLHRRAGAPERGVRVDGGGDRDERCGDRDSGSHGHRL